MNTTQLVRKFSKESGLSEDIARDYYNIFMQCIEDGLRLDGRVEFRNYFSLMVKQFESRNDIISQLDGKLYQVGRKQKLRIRPSMIVKDLLNNNEYLVTHISRKRANGIDTE